MLPQARNTALENELELTRQALAAARRMLTGANLPVHGSGASATLPVNGESDSHGTTDIDES